MTPCAIALCAKPARPAMMRVWPAKQGLIPAGDRRDTNPMRSLRWVRFMAGLVAAALLLTPARPAAADGGGGDAWVQTVDGYAVQLAFPEGIADGVKPVQVHLTDEHGAPVAAARVQVVQTWVGALTTDSHGDTSADDLADADTHGQTSAGDHSLDSAHADEDTHGAELEPADHSAAGAGDHSSAAADPHSEAEPHTHDTSVLFQLAADAEAGTYTGTVIFFETGQYAVHLNFAVGEREHSTEFVVVVPPPDRGRTVLAVFAGLNVAIIGAAAVIKRKSAAA